MTHVVIPLYEGVTPLDFAGPYQLLRALPEMDIELAAIDRKKIVADGLTFGELLDLETIEACDIQVMSAGTGIRHSEYNLEPETTKLFQIWIVPSRKGGQPAWGSKPFPKDARSGRFVRLASGFAEDDDALPIRADARLLGATLKAGETTAYTLAGSRFGYLVPATGAVEVNGVRIDARDAAAITDIETVNVTALKDSEIVLVDAA